MIAVVGLHDAGVTGLARVVKAPFVKGIDHLAGIHILVQPAVGAAAGVLRVFVCQRGKGILRCFACLPLVQQRLRLLLSLCPRFVGIRAVLVLLGRDHENVPHAHHGLVDLFNPALRVVLGMLVIVIADLRVGKLHLLNKQLHVPRSAHRVAHKRHIILYRHARPEDPLQIRKAVFHAVIARRRVQAFRNRVELRLVLFAELEARLVGLQIDGRHRVEHRDCTIQKCLLPRLTLAVGLLVESL